MNKVVNLKHHDKQEIHLEWADVLSEMAEHKDKKKFSAVFAHFAPRVKSYILRLGLTESVAEELMQEAMINVWRNSSSYDKTKAAASTWIFTIARNISIDWMRQQKYPTYQLADESEIDETQDSLCVKSQGEDLVMHSQVARILATLPENQAQVIYMSFYEGRTHSDIAKRLGIPLGSVKSRIRLASAKFKAAWGE